MPPRGRAGRQTSGDGFTASAFTRTWQMADMTSWIRSVQVHRNAARPREKRLAHHRGRWGRSALATPTAGCWPAASDVLALRATCCTCEPFVSRAYLATLIDAFWVGLQPVRRRRPSAHCEAPSHPPSDIPCSRARAGPLRDAARHRPPEKNHSHLSRLDNVATWMGPDQLLSHAPLRRCARAPVALTAYGWPSFKTSVDPDGFHKVRARRGGQARADRASERTANLQSVHTADVRAEESTVNNYGVLGFLCVSDALFSTHVNSSWYN